MSQPDSIEELVAEYVDRRERGEQMNAEAFAADHPNRRDRLLQALRDLEVTESLFPTVTRPPLERLGPYRLTREIGRGGMGRVFEAFHEDRPGESLALKILDPAFVLDERAASRFRREGRLLTKLDHPHVVRVHEADVDSGTPYLVLDFVDGPSLASLLVQARDRPATSPRCAALSLGNDPPFARIAHLIASLARAVEAVHRAGLIHRDLKPANALLTESGEPTLVDFGLARGEASQSLTGTGDLLGTPRYMAPEQARGEAASERTDVYGLGAILHELLTLEPPHGEMESLALWRRIQQQPLPSVRRCDRSIPRDLETIVRRALAFSPRRRYASAQSMADDLEAFAEGRPIQARAYSASEHVLDLWQSRRRSIVASLLVIVGMVVGVLVSWPGHQNPIDPSWLAGRMEQAALAWLSEDRERLGVLGREVAEAGVPEGELLLALGGEGRGDLPEEPFAAALIEGDRHARARRWDTALASFTRATQLEPTSALALAMLARAAREGEDLERAEYELRTAIRSVSDSPELWFGLAEVLWRRKLNEESLEAIDRALALDEDEYRFHFRRARLLFHLDRAAEALETAERAREVCSQDPLPQDLLDVLGVLYSGQERRQEARAIWRVLLERRPGHVKWLYDIALSYDSDDEFEKAMSAYQDVLAVDPDHVGSLANLAFLASGSKRETCERCRHYFDEDPTRIDLEAAKDFAMRAVTSSRGGSEQALWVAVETARRSGWPPEIEKQLEELLLDADSTDADRVVLLQRYLRTLRRESRR